MDTELITKRLHISGLTPSISVADLSRRLSAFGNVKELDGFGKLDALGQPRKFGYVTLEGTKGQLAKCEHYILCERLLSKCVDGRYKCLEWFDMEGYETACWVRKTRLSRTVCLVIYFTYLSPLTSKYFTCLSG